MTIITPAPPESGSDAAVAAADPKVAFWEQVHAATTAAQARPFADGVERQLARLTTEWQAKVRPLLRAGRMSEGGADPRSSRDSTLRKHVVDVYYAVEACSANGFNARDFADLAGSEAIQAFEQRIERGQWSQKYTGSIMAAVDFFLRLEGLTCSPAFATRQRRFAKAAAQDKSHLLHDVDLAMDGAAALLAASRILESLGSPQSFRFWRYAVVLGLAFELSLRRREFSGLDDTAVRPDPRSPHPRLTVIVDENASKVDWPRNAEIVDARAIGLLHSVQARYGDGPLIRSQAGGKLSPDSVAKLLGEASLFAVGLPATFNSCRGAGAEAEHNTRARQDRLGQALSSYLAETTYHSLLKLVTRWQDLLQQEIKTTMVIADGRSPGGEIRIHQRPVFGSQGDASRRFGPPRGAP